MGDIEWCGITPEEMIREIETFVQRSKEINTLSRLA